ncbi:MAG: hypothetical protein RL076_2760 [Chloroflexota bacterium]
MCYLHGSWRHNKSGTALEGNHVVMRILIVTCLVALTAGILNGAAALADYLAAQQPAKAPDEERGFVMVDFTKPDATSAWFSLNDGVMGGVSQSALVPTDTGSAIFQGIVSFENNGGFATMQTNFAPARNLRVYDGLLLRVRSDGKRYGIYLRTAQQSVVYQATFVAPRDSWHEVRLRWSDFVPTRFGRQVRADALDPSDIRALSLLIEFKQEGPFALEVKHIGVFEE